MDKMPMKTRALPISFSLCVFALFAAIPGQVRADDTHKAIQPAIYDESADGAKLVADALTIARTQGKCVLLEFGANWCIWCHRLHNLFEADKSIAEKLKQNYIVVMVDVNDDHNKDIDAKYGNPRQTGLPAIVILDSAGKQLTTVATSTLEEDDHHNPQKVLSMLEEWAPKKGRSGD